MSQARNLTRDLLLEYDPQVMSFHYRMAGLSVVYPWENMNRAIVSKEIYEIAKNSGFEGSEEEFWKSFSGGIVVRGTIETFPVPGNELNLYLDDNTNVVYFFKAIRDEVDDKVAEEIGAYIVGSEVIKFEDGEDDVLYLYIPIRALPLLKTLIVGGEI